MEKFKNIFKKGKDLAKIGLVVGAGLASGTEEVKAQGAVRSDRTLEINAENMSKKTDNNKTYNFNDHFEDGKTLEARDKFEKAKKAIDIATTYNKDTTVMFETFTFSNGTIKTKTDMSSGSKFILVNGEEYKPLSGGIITPPRVTDDGEAIWEISGKGENNFLFLPTEKILNKKLN